MLSIKQRILKSPYVQKLIYAQNWNIGFPQIDIEGLVSGRSFETQWMKHPYKDRFFADPFIYSVSDSQIVLLAEELVFDENKGRIVRLVVNRKNYKLVDRTVVLEKDTHLSYPAILFLDGACYIYPENGASGKLSLYRYDDATASVNQVNVLYDGALADATIFPCDNGYMMLATETAHHDVDLSVYYCKNPLSEKFVKGDVVFREKNGARSAGNMICINSEYYRPAQDCTKNYGGALVIQKVTSMNEKPTLDNILTIYPVSKKYPLALHTLNCREGICVIDGNGYLYPCVGRLLSFKHKII